MALRLHPCFFIRLAHGSQMFLTGLMGYDRARVAPKARQRRRHNIVERAGTQAATDDKHAQWPPARLITLFNRLDPHHGGPDWITYHQGSRPSPGETRDRKTVG